MEIFTIPLEDKFILYRPLLQTAFVGNGAMANLVLDLAADEASPIPDAPEEALTFLQNIRFLEPDPEPPAPPDDAFRPTMAVLLLTNRCQLRCVYCYANAGEMPAQELSMDLARVAVDHVCQNAIDLGQPQFGLSFHGGGEPTQAWETLQAATVYARHKPLPCHVSVTTNGVWSRQQRAWVLGNLDSLTLSVDGARETQDRQRPLASGRSSSQIVMRTIQALDRVAFSYGIRMTATAPWRERLPRDVRFLCEEAGCQQIQVEPAFNAARGEHRWPTPSECQAFAEAFMEAFEIASRAGRRLYYSGARPWLLAQSFCTAPHNALIVGTSGTLVACYEVTAQDHRLAQMSTVGRIEGGQVVVDHQARAALYARFAERRALCRDCFCYWHCAGDCYVRTFSAEPGSHKVLGQRCHMNREITAKMLLWYIMEGGGVWRGRGTGGRPGTEGECEEC